MQCQKCFLNNMAIIVGITGGISSGKTTIAKYLESLGYKVYYADDAGKRVMQQQTIIDEIVSIFDNNVLNTDGSLNRKAIADVVFSNPDKLKQLNNIVHPAVANDFKKILMTLGEDEVIIKESAILFESKGNESCDFVILITAPEDVRVQRVIERDGVSEQEVKNRMNNQLPELEKAQKADFVLNNFNLNQSFDEILTIFEKIKRN